jgi:hypothetical protein
MKTRINANLRGPQAGDVAVGSKPRALHGLAIAAGMVTIFGAAPARAQTSWIDATGSWFTAANWSAGAPPNFGGTIVGNGGTAQIALRRRCGPHAYY